MKGKYIIFILLFFNAISGFSQCAMCRATLENNVSQGNPGIAAGINFGILYLLVMPYMAVLLIAFFWYRASRKNSSGSINEGALAG